MSRARALAGLVVLALAGWLLVSVFTTPEAAAEIRPFNSSRECAQLQLIETPRSLRPTSTES